MIDPPMAPDPLVQHWLKRHRSPISFVMHMIGIPPTILGVLFVSIYVYLLSVPIFLLALALFVGGYVLQFAGHLLEGTDPGEIIYFKRRLGLRYVEFPPARGAPMSTSPVNDATREPSGLSVAPACERAGSQSGPVHLVGDGVSFSDHDEVCAEAVIYSSGSPAVSGTGVIN
jgi:hypothetical protein